MVEQGGELPEKIVEGIQREAKEEIARVECLVRELDMRKRDTMACRTTRRAQRMSVGMGLLQGDTTRIKVRLTTPHRLSMTLAPVMINS
jgi:hypothetical protein